MTLVLSKSRYTNQTRNKIISILNENTNIQTKVKIKNVFNLSNDEYSDITNNYVNYARLISNHIKDYEDFEVYRRDDQMFDYLYHQDSNNFAQNYGINNDKGRKKAGAVIWDLIQDDSILYFDENAIHMLQRSMYTDNTNYTTLYAKAETTNFIKNCMKFTLFANKINYDNFEQVYKNCSFLNSPSKDFKKFERYIEFSSWLIYRSSSFRIKCTRLFNSGKQAKHDSIKKEFGIIKNMNIRDRVKIQLCKPFDDMYDCYNVLGILILIKKGSKNILFLDNSATDYFRHIAIAAFNNTVYFENYRICGNSEYIDMSKYMIKVRAWICDQLTGRKKDSELARHMHLSHTLKIAMLGAAEAEVIVENPERVKVLTEDILNTYPNNLNLYNMINSFPIPESTKCELFKVNFELSPPDINYVELHNATEENPRGAPKPNAVKVRNLRNFSCAYFFARFVSKKKKVPAHECEPGYDFSQKFWFLECMKGRMTLPPIGERGKVRIFGHYKYRKTADVAYLKASDVTRIEADLDLYMSREPNNRIGRDVSNELLHALSKGPIVYKDKTMADLRIECENGIVSFPCIAAIAGKPEHHKIVPRETLSACEPMREFLSEADSNLRSATELLPNRSIMMPAVKAEKTYMKMAHSLKRDLMSPGQITHFGFSTDAKKWSPWMNRDMHMIFWRLMLEMTDISPGMLDSLEEMWRRLILFTDRRGFKEHFFYPEGMIQGWTAMADTSFHGLLLVNTAYDLYDQKLVTRKYHKKVRSLATIDDAAQVMAIEGTHDEKVQKAKEIKEKVIENYKDVGITVDKIKSRFQTNGFDYLNRVYIDGALVPMASKTFSKIFHELETRFSSIYDKVQTVCNGAYAATAQGADPFVCIMLAYYYCYQWVCLTTPDFRCLSATRQMLYFFAPTSLNGIGAPTILHAYTTGVNDNISTYFELLRTNLLRPDLIDVRDYVDSIIDMEFKRPTPQSIFNDPYSVTAKYHTDPNRDIRKALLDKCIQNGMAEPFISLVRLENSVSYAEVIADILCNYNYDAQVIESISDAMPTSLIREIIDKCDRSEIIVPLLRQYDIARLGRSQKNAVYNNFKAFNKMLVVRKFDKENNRLLINSSYGVAITFRKRYHEMANVIVLNSTYPDSFTMLAYKGMFEKSTQPHNVSCKVDFSRCVRTCITSNHGKNFFDNASDKVPFRGHTSYKGATGYPIKAKVVDVVSKKIVSGSMALMWASANNREYVGLGHFFFYTWYGDPNLNRLTVIPPDLMSGLCRLSASHLRNTHMFAPFPNIQSLISVNIAALDYWFKNDKNLFDGMKIVTDAKCALSLDTALRYSIDKDERKMFYTFSTKDHAFFRLEVPETNHLAFNLNIFNHLVPFFMMDIPQTLKKSISDIFEGSLLVDTIDDIVKESIHDADVAVNYESNVYATGGEEHMLSMNLIGITVGSMQGVKVVAAKTFRKRRIDGGLVTDLGVDLPKAPPVIYSTGKQQLEAMKTTFLHTAALDMILENPWLAANLYANRKSVSNLYKRKPYGKSETFGTLLKEYFPSALNIHKFYSQMVTRCPNSLENITAIMVKLFGKIESKNPFVFTLDQIRSFCGHEQPKITFWGQVADQLVIFKHNTAEKYMQINVLTNDPSIVRNVVIAQWTFGAYRRLVHFDEAKRLKRNYQATFGNDELVDNRNILKWSTYYATAASRALTPDGHVFSKFLTSSFIEATVKCIKEIMRKDEETQRGDFKEVDIPTMVANPDNATLDRIEVVEAVCALAIQKLCLFSNEKDDIIAAATEVNNWITNDLGRDSIKRMLTFADPRTNRSTVSSQCSQPTSLPELPTTIEILPDIFGGALGGNDDALDNLLLYEPSAVFLSLYRTNKLPTLRAQFDSEVDAFNQITHTEDVYINFVQAHMSILNEDDIQAFEMNSMPLPAWKMQGEGDIMQD